MAIIEEKAPSDPPQYECESAPPRVSDDKVSGDKTPPVVVVPAESSSAPSEAEWQAKLDVLEKRIEKYNKKRRRSDEAAILAAMHDLAAVHPDPKVKDYWTRRADEFEKAPEADKLVILKDIIRAMRLLLAAPLTIAALLLIGTGTLVKVSGEWISGRRSLSKKKSKPDV
ncbi:6PF2K domain-containing protein [Mycena indigotica]|uniref:6PF2K domain-containing protein n=1 Tax=Mycena indigotica TaxID=2126181 RepID=A0A8H6SK60_9AGAR|nr:6PF2K domain-containing protein [Mycena indigotica]KAF7301205.1 6PF2K domain-containing protein [Mycena indigotica]